MTDDPSTRLAENVKQLRAARGQTQAQLARLAEVPRATLAHLESGAGNPTLAVLLRVAAALQVSLEELVAAPRAACRLYPRAGLPVRKKGDVSIRGLLPDPLPGISLERMELPPGARMAGVPHMPGTREYLTCESGSIQLVVQGQRFDLAQGDVVVFRGDQAHSYRNTSGRAAVGYSVVLLAGAAPEAPAP
jgi:XRE family transcriptional regulator, regulator of sulfur utilization